MLWAPPTPRSRSATGKFFSSGAALSQERLDAVMSGKLQNNGISASMAE